MVRYSVDMKICIGPPAYDERDSEYSDLLSSLFIVLLFGLHFGTVLVWRVVKKEKDGILYRMG